MAGAVGSSMVGLYFGKYKGEPRVFVRKYLDIYLVCKTCPEKKFNKRAEIMADAGRNKDLAELIKNHIEAEDIK